MIERFLLVWLLVSSCLAYWWPQVGALFPSGSTLNDPFVASVPLLNWLIATTMFSIGLMLPRDEVDQVIRRWPAVFAGSALQYTVMPLLAYAMGHLWGLEGDYLVGIVVVGCVPGAMASNVLTLNARGNTSYSVSLTTTATLLSPLAVPLVLRIALATDESVNTEILLRASRMLLITVVAPVLLGHFLGRHFPAWEPHSRWWGSRIANLAILWIIAVVVGVNRQELSHFRPDVIAALLSVNGGGYVAGYFGGYGFRLPEPMRRALTLEIGMQNAGLGAALATELFPERSAIAIAPAAYTFGCMLTGTVLARVWTARSVKSVKSVKSAKSVKSVKSERS